MKPEHVFRQVFITAVREAGVYLGIKTYKLPKYTPRVCIGQMTERYGSYGLNRRGNAREIVINLDLLDTDKTDPAGTLWHEMIHAAAFHLRGHGGNFDREYLERHMEIMAFSIPNPLTPKNKWRKRINKALRERRKQN